MHVLGIEGVHPKGTPDIFLNVKQGRKDLKGTEASVTKKSFRSLKTSRIRAWRSIAAHPGKRFAGRRFEDQRSTKLEDIKMNDWWYL